MPRSKRSPKRRPQSLRRTVAGALFSGALALVCLALVLPGLMGLYLARERQRVIAGLEVPGVARLAILDFEPGWFRSRLKLRVIPAMDLCPARACPPPIVRSVIYHGPVPWAAPSAGDNTGPLALAVVESFLPLGPFFGPRRVQPVPPTLHVVTRVALDAGVRVAARLPRISLGLPDEGGLLRIRAAPLVITATIPGPDPGMSLRLDWPRFSVVGAHGGQLKFQGLQVAIRGEDTDPTWWDHYRLGLDGVWVAGFGGEAVAIHDLQFRASAPATAGAKASFSLGVARITTRGEDYGPTRAGGQIALVGAGGTLLEGWPPWPALGASALMSADSWVGVLALEPALTVQHLRSGTQHGLVRAELTLTTATAPPRLHGRARLRLPRAILANLVGAVLRHRYPRRAAPTTQEVAARIRNWLQRGLITHSSAGEAFVVEAAIDGADVRVRGQELHRWYDLLEQLDYPATGSTPGS
ncbi:MAG: YdgA family protein [Salinisphaera sp.]|nr:YdgA family protein [Salinisphaera sp.]